MAATAQIQLTADKASTEAAAQAALDSVFNTPRQFVGKILQSKDRKTVTFMGVDVAPATIQSYIVRAVDDSALTTDPSALVTVIDASGDPGNLTIVDWIETEFGYFLVVFGSNASASGTIGFTQFAADPPPRTTQATFNGSDLGGGISTQAVLLNGTGLIPANAVSVLMGISWQWNFRQAVGAAGDQRLVQFAFRDRVGNPNLEQYNIGLLYHTLGAVGPLTGLQSFMTLDVPLSGAGTIEIAQLSASHDFVDMVIDIVLIGAYTGA